MSFGVLKVLLFFTCLTVSVAIFFRPNLKVDCTVTGWSPWGSPDTAGKQTRIRRIMRYPQNGGDPCPHLNETRDAPTCRTTPWSKWSENFGFGQQSRIRKIVPSPLAGKQCNLKLEEVRYTGQAPTVTETAKNLQNFFMRPSGGKYFLKSAFSNNPDAALPRDLALIMDSSGSIGGTRFQSAKDQTSRLIGLLCPIPPFDRVAGFPYQYNQAAMITFSTSVVVNFNFNTYSTTAQIQNAIRGAAYEGRSTNTHLAFDTARGLFVPTKGVRDKARAKREVLILSDGLSTYKSKTFEAVAKLKQEADIYALLIGRFTQAGMDELTQYVSSPIKQHLFYLKNFTDLKVLVDQIEAMKNAAGQDWCAPFNPPIGGKMKNNIEINHRNAIP